MTKNKITKRRNQKLITSIQSADDSLAILYGQKEFQAPGTGFLTFKR